MAYTKTPSHMSVGRDYALNSLVRYEYVLYADDESIVLRSGCFKTAAQARKAGMAAAKQMQEAR